MQDTPQFSEMPEPIRKIMKSSIEQAKKAFDTFISATEKAISNVDASSATTTDGLRELNDKIAQFTKSNAEANFRFALKLADARQLNDVIEMQYAHVREQMDTYTQQLEELRELTARVIKETAQNAASNLPNVASFGGGANA